MSRRLNITTPKPAYVVAAALAIAPLATSTLAQDLFPSTYQYDQHIGLPNDGRFEILDFALLQTPQEVDEAISASGYEVDTIFNHDVRGIKNRSGDQASFAYGRQAMKLRKPQNSGWDILNIRFASGLHDNRVTSLRRSLNPENEFAIDAVKKQIEEKYGEPSFVQVVEPYTTTYFYFFDDGELLRSSDGLTQTVEIKECFYLKNDIPTSDSGVQYKFKEQRTNRHPNCSGAIEVNIIHGSRQDLVERLEITMFDYDLYHADLTAQDQFLLETLNAAIAAKVGDGAPKL